MRPLLYYSILDRIHGQSEICTLYQSVGDPNSTEPVFCWTWAHQYPDPEAVPLILELLLPKYQRRYKGCRERFLCRIRPGSDIREKTDPDLTYEKNRSIPDPSVKKNRNPEKTKRLEKCRRAAVQGSVRQRIIYYRKYILQITQPSQYSCKQVREREREIVCERERERVRERES